MPLGPPPSRSILRTLPSRRLDHLTLWRVHRRDRHLWWFASVTRDNWVHAGRFDLPEPEGSCYLATDPASAVLEALQADFHGGRLPASALRARALSSVDVPELSPRAAWLTAARAAGAGVTVGLWADRDRLLTQLWAVELHGSGWQAAYHGAQHEPDGRGRAVTLFDRAGAHPPWGAPWPEPHTTSLDTPANRAVLARHGIAVVDGLRPDLEVLDAAPATVDPTTTAGSVREPGPQPTP